MTVSDPALWHTTAADDGAQTPSRPPCGSCLRCGTTKFTTFDVCPTCAAFTAHDPATARAWRRQEQERRLEVFVLGITAGVPLTVVLLKMTGVLP